MNIADLSIKRPVFIIMIIFSIIVLGVVGYSKLPVDLLPDVDFPNLTVYSNYPGASSNEIETLITKPLENALGTVEGLDTISSSTREGVSQIMIAFKLGTDLKFAELKVREKVDATMPKLPTDLTSPSIRRFSSEDIPIVICAVRGNKSRADITEMIKNDIQNKLEAAEGVGAINIFGGLDRILKVSIDRAILQANQLTYNQISTAIAARNISKPIGVIQGTEKEINVRVYGKSDTAEDIGNITLTTKDKKVLRIKDIAKIQLTEEDEIMRARVKGKNAVLFAVYKQSGENTITVADNIKKAIVDIQKDMPSEMSIDLVNDTSVNIKRSVNGVQEDILVGALLAILVVWIFLGNFRSTIITAVALPNSLLGAFFLVFIAGFTINVMTLLSLSLAVGLLIDDSIVVRENIFRHVELGQTPKVAASLGTKEVGLAVLSTTLSILSVFIPISFLSGVVGQFFKQFGLTVAFALMISLLDAFTSAPMLSAYWYKESPKNPKGIAKHLATLSHKWNEFYNAFNDIYKKILEWSLGHKKKVMLSVIGLIAFVFTLLFLGALGGNFANPTDLGAYEINLEIYPGAPLDKIDFYAKNIEKFLDQQKEIDTYYTTVGQGQQTHRSSINVIMKPLNKRKISTQDLIKKTRDYIRKNFDKNITYRLNEQAAFQGGGSGSPVNLNIYGNDFKTLERLSQQIGKIISETPGTRDINSTLRPGTPELVIRLDTVKAEKVGITTVELGNILRDLIQGATVSTYSVGDNDYDIILRMNEVQRNSINSFGNLMISTKTGKKVLLNSFCDLTYSSAPLEIRRESNQRIVKITGNLEKGYSLTKVISDAKKLITQNVSMPSGYRYDFVGQQKDLADLFKQILLAILLALIFMYMILASLYNSLIQPFYIMISIPLAMIGSFLALIITGIDIDVYGFIGILLVIGLVVKNSILLIDFTNKMREEGMSIKEALLHAGPIRLRPILMTSFTMIAGMMPLALGLNEGSSGRQALPMTVIGGLLTSTFLTLVVVPIIYIWIETILEKRRLRKHPELKNASGKIKKEKTRSNNAKRKA